MVAMSSRVLSIQSHVVHGYVGNRSSVFPLQLLGIEVDYINSVQFSNHTGYSCVKGQVMDACDLKELYAGLKANGLHTYTHVLTGYVGCASFLEAVGDLIRDLKAENPQLKYYCDPVLGDSGELYVSPDLVPVYKEKILPLADVILPNQFEAELLTGCPITDEASALECIRPFHSKYHIPTVVLTSSNIRYSSNAYPDAKDRMLGYASRCISSEPHRGDLNSMRPSDSESIVNGCDTYEQLRLVIPVLDCEFRGTGDLFSALTLARIECGLKSQLKSSFANTFELVLRSMQAVLRRTLDESKSQKGATRPDSPNWASRELKLVQSIDDIRNPPANGQYVERIQSM
ncbi:Pyridoxal kinase [Clonorchis sinensis]|uniref:Pyridoxal kinase n=1 Tax=Clonorchis sinensis TaxID=79923 RepID=A0A8T1MZT4_CLOSI|nr:Pyridoxal kinase [Clonorchis sinensis]